MKKIVDMMQEGGGEMRVEQYLFVFLKCVCAPLLGAGCAAATDCEMRLTALHCGMQIHGIHHPDDRVRPHAEREDVVRRRGAAMQWRLALEEEWPLAGLVADGRSLLVVGWDSGADDRLTVLFLHVMGMAVRPLFLSG